MPQQQSRDWMMTVRAEGHTEDEVRSLFERIGTGAVFQKEEGGETGYVHFQCFLQTASPMRWSTLKGHLTKAGFKDAHLEARKGSVADCVKYCTKQDTRIGEPVYVGDIRMKDGQGSRTDLGEMRAKILDGYSVDDVLLEDVESKAAKCTKWLNELAAARDRRAYGRQMRDLEVHYLWGAPGVGKTSYVYSRHPIEDIYRVTDYQHPFDEYDRQNVLVLDEYDSQFDWEKLLCYLDRYPLVLPARYHNHQACYTIVWLISNKPFAEQYPSISGERRFAFIRRLTDSSHMLAGGELVRESMPGQKPKEAGHEHT